MVTEGLLGWLIPHTEDVEHLVGEIADRCEAWLDRQMCGSPMVAQGITYFTSDGRQQCTE
jgi:hypothetical protein